MRMTRAAQARAGTVGQRSKTQYSYREHHNWTWVNGEGQIFDGYTDWDQDEPNNGSEDCMLMLKAGRGFHWDDRLCSNVHWFLEEVDLETPTVMINGHDSGVEDVLVDAELCSYLIMSGLSRCSGGRVNSSDIGFVKCVDQYLTGLAANGFISASDRDAIFAASTDTAAATNTTRYAEHTTIGT